MPQDHSNPHHQHLQHAIETPLPGPFDDELPPRDPGTSYSRLVALWAAILLAAVTIVWQHLPEDTQYNTLQLTPPAYPESQLVVSSMEQGSMIGRMAIKFEPIMASDPASLTQLINMVDDGALTPEDRVVAVVVAGELEGPEVALERLAKIRDDLAISLTLPPVPTPETNPESTPIPGDPGPKGEPQTTPTTISPNADLLRDLEDLTTVYLAGSRALDDLSATRLRARYSYFGDVALTHDLDDSNDEYTRLRAGGLVILLGLVTFGAVIVLAFIAGLVLLAIGILNHAGHPERREFQAPAPGGSVMLETYALFVGGFLAVSIAGSVINATRPELAIFTLPLQFSLMAVCLWPLLRGMNLTAWRQAVGLVAPRGVFREIGFGFLAYLAAVPVFIAGVLVTVVLLLISEAIKAGGGAPLPPEPPANPVIELVAQGDWIVIGLLALLATVWAPITEELIFRGALFRHLRARLHWVVAALVVAVLFSAMHTYPVIMLTPLVILGFMFAAMREIRGSIIASITAHFIHNATLIAVMAFVLRPLLV